VHAMFTLDQNVVGVFIGCHSRIAADAHLKAEMFAALIYLVGTSTGAPLSFTKNTTNFAGLVWLAFRPTR
jgi:hypothetical protein